MKFENKSFKNETIDIDFNSFINCQFEDCMLVFRGYGLIGMEGCTFTNVSWSMAGAAANTLKFMAGIYHGAGEGGKNIIEATFMSIRKGKGDT
ncbi:hypothetical protein [Nitrosospira briensis]|uniref:hypothetical protein n=1 Tax=Nitrosospira briensis TaxID=35799 RepID=UPI00046AF581|nr:hypothetical protein [Nitrosospira briensis]